MQKVLNILLKNIEMFIQNIQITKIKFRRIVELLFIKRTNKINFFDFKLINFRNFTNKLIISQCYINNKKNLINLSKILRKYQ